MSRTGKSADLAKNRDTDRSKRVLTALSQCSGVLLRETDEQKLLESVCRIVVDVGGYLLAWVGYAEDDAAKTVRPAARYGADNGYIDTLDISYADIARGQGPVGTAIRECAPCIIQDGMQDSRFAPWAERAAQRGFRAGIGVPLLDKEVAFGALNIYADTPNAFDADEVRLLEGLANNLAYGVASIRSRKKRDEAAQALAKSEERFQDMAANVPGIVYQFKIDAEGGASFPYVSPTIREILGLDPDAVVANANVWFDQILPDDKPGLDASIEQSYRTLDLWKWEGRMTDQAGEVRWFGGSSTPKKLGDGSVLWNGVVFEITEIQKAHEQQRLSIEEGAEKEIRRRQQLLYNAIDIMQDGFVLFDAEDKLVICNQRYKDIYREIADVLEVGNTFTQIIEAAARKSQVLAAKVDRERYLQERLEAHLNPTGPFDQELTRGDWVRVIEQKTAEGGIVGLRIDISKEKAEQEQLRKLFQALEQSPSLVFITDRQGNIEYVNAAFRRITGYADQEVIGRNPRLLKSGETPPETYQDLWAAILSGTEWRGEIKDRRKDGGEFWAYATIAPIKDEAGETTHFVAMHEDITDRKEAALRERLAREEAEKASNAKSDFLSAMSHELRTPLNAILGFAQLMESDPNQPLSEEQADGVAHILKSGNYLLELINEILDLSRIEAGKLNIDMTSVPMAQVVADCIRLVDSAAKTRRIRIDQGRLDLDTRTVRADATRLKQVILNLLSNAVKYNVEGGTISLSSSVLEDQVLRLAIKDTGIGISASETAYVFDPFSRLGRSATDIEGTGIGLTITKKLVELMQGTIDFETEEGAGSCFWVEFPLGDPGTETHASADLSVGSKPARPDDSALKVIYIEDDPVNVHLMESVLKRYGNVELEVTHTAELGLSFIENNAVDLVLMDINLPGMSGLDATRAIRADGKLGGLPIIAISANATESDIQKGLDAGADAYITKPLNVPTFLETLAELLAPTEK